MCPPGQAAPSPLRRPGLLGAKLLWSPALWQVLFHPQTMLKLIQKKLLDRIVSRAFRSHSPCPSPEGQACPGVHVLSRC